MADELLPARIGAASAADQVRELLEPHKVAILAKLSELAEAGDPRSIELALRYIAPPARPEAEKVVVPGLLEAPTLPAKANAILAAVASGQISAEAGDRLLRMLAAYGEAVMLQSQEERLRAIEGMKKRKPPLPPPAHDFRDIA